MKYKICIWGLGKIYNQFVNTLKYFVSQQMIEITALTAREVPRCQYLDGWRIVAKEDLKKIPFDYIVVMSKNTYNDIEKEIINYTGIKQNNIIPYRVFTIPNLDFDTYVTLKNSKLSIVSNNCWGGLVYHTLGLECISPFKNLFIEDEDYIRLLQRLDYYMGCVPIFYEKRVEIHSKQEYPVLLLDDIKVHCNHSMDSTQAIEDWIRRSRKFNWDNILVEMYTTNAESEKNFLELDKYKRKICFVSHLSQNRNTYELKLSSEQKELWEAVNSCAIYGHNGGLMYNLVELLSGNENSGCVKRVK